MVSREVGHLLQFQEDRSEEGKRLFTRTSFDAERDLLVTPVLDAQ